MASSLSDFTATGNGAALDTIDLAWTVTVGVPPFDSIQIDYKTGANWINWTSVGGSVEVKTGFSTLDNTAYDFRIRGVTASIDIDTEVVYDVGNYIDTQTETVTSDDSSSESVGFTDTKTETLSLSSTGGEVVTLSDTHIEILSISDSATAAAVSPLETTFRYYLGSFEGKMYSELAEAYSDDGAAINAIWESKDLDFGDKYEELTDRKKTLYKVRLNYVDKTAGADVSVDASTDGGTTWAQRGKSIGTGSGKTKDAIFHFVKTGVYFRFRVVNNTTSDQFQWTRLVPLFVDAGENF